MESRQTCICCGHVEVVTSTKISIDVPISGKDSTSEAVLSYLLRSTTTKMWCDVCMKFSETIVLKNIRKTPEILCVKLLRFDHWGEQELSPVKLSETITLPSGAKYNFMGCGVHSGNTLSAGQTMALFKCNNGSFKLISDAQVKNVSYESVHSSEAIKRGLYVIIFERDKSEEGFEDPNISHISLDAENASVNMSIQEVSPVCSTHKGSWLVSPNNNIVTQSRKGHVSSARRFLDFTVEATASKNLSPIPEEDITKETSSLPSPHQVTEHNDQYTDTSVHNDSITSYVSAISPPSRVPPRNPQRVSVFKPRALDMNVTDASNKSGTSTIKEKSQIVHILNESISMEVSKSEMLPSSKTPKTPVRQLKKFRRRQVPKDVKPERAVVRYETCRSLPEKKFKFFTGLSQYNFSVLFNLIGGDEGIKKLKYEYNEKTPMKSLPFRKFSSENRLFLTLVRMRRGVPLVDLAFIFKISTTQCSVICYAMIRCLYEYLSLLQPHMFISSDEQKKDMPAQFRQFQNLRVIIDAAEFHIERPSDFQQQGNTFSAYKHYNTEKYLIGISCYGAIIYCSDGFEGSKSDKEIFKESGIMDYLQKGDSVMADRGFNVQSELAAIGVHLIKPPDFNKGRQYLNPRQEMLTRETATARIYVEHAIKSIKEWRILKNVVPMSLHDILPDMVFIAAFLSNFNKPYIQLRGNKK